LDSFFGTVKRKESDMFESALFNKHIKPIYGKKEEIKGHFVEFILKSINQLDFMYLSIQKSVKVISENSIDV
jgi:hypothetical protein